MPNILTFLSLKKRKHFQFHCSSSVHPFTIPRNYWYLANLQPSNISFEHSSLWEEVMT